jgi:hypothetical protein
VKSKFNFQSSNKSNRIFHVFDPQTSTLSFERYNCGGEFGGIGPINLDTSSHNMNTHEYMELFLLAKSGQKVKIKIKNLKTN